MKRALRKYDRMGIGPIDIALLDYAGKKYDAPIHELLGTYRERLPTYASTYRGDRSDWLDTPKPFADFAETCLGMGYGGISQHAHRKLRQALDTPIVQTEHAGGSSHTRTSSRRRPRILSGRTRSTTAGSPAR